MEYGWTLVLINVKKKKKKFVYISFSHFNYFACGLQLLSKIVSWRRMTKIDNCTTQPLLFWFMFSILNFILTIFETLLNPPLKNKKSEMRYQSTQLMNCELFILVYFFFFPLRTKCDRTLKIEPLFCPEVTRKISNLFQL